MKHHEPGVCSRNGKELNVVKIPWVISILMFEYLFTKNTQMWSMTRTLPGLQKRKMEHSKGWLLRPDILQCVAFLLLASLRDSALSHL